MPVIEQGITTADLESIGTVAVLGASILEGEARAFVKPTLGGPEDAINAGYFGVDKCKFRMVYPFTEQACVVSGEVVLTNENTGERVHYKPGDSWLFEKGTPVLWDVRTDDFVKHYLAAS